MRFSNPVKPAMIKAEAGRRIEARYPLFKQVNIDRTGGAPQAEMAAFIDAVIDASHRLEQSMPADFAADRHWPTA